MAPMGVDPGIEAGFKAADQQSYLQQVLQNTRAEQNNAAALKAQQEQRTFDPSSLDDPNLPADERAARKRDVLSFAQGAQPGPNGQPHAIYKTADELKNALDHMKNQAGQRAAVSGDKNLADATEMNLQPQHMAKDGSGKPDALIARHLAVLRGANPLDPNRAESRKVIGDLGLYKAALPLGGQGVDTTGQPTGPANMPTGEQAGIVTPDSAEGRARRNAGMVSETKTDPYGRTTYDWKDARAGKDITDWHAYQALRAANIIPPQTDFVDAMGSPAMASLINDKKVGLQAQAGGLKTTVNVNATNQANSPANKPASPKELATLWLPEKGDFAVNVPGVHGMSVGDIVDKYKAVDANTRGGLATVMKSQQAVDAGKQHIDEIIQAWDDAYKAGYIPNQRDAAIPGAVAAKLAAWKNAITAGNDPILAKLTALGAGDLNILSAMAPPTGNRFGYSLMKYVNEKNPAVLGSQGYTYEGGRGSLLAWRKLADIKGQTQGVGALNNKPGQTEGVAPPAAPGPPSAGVSGQSPYAKWKASQGAPQ